MRESEILTRFSLVIFDADDTLRTTTVPGKPCPHNPDEWELMPSVRDTLGQVAWGMPEAPYLGLASNQDQVAYGHLSIAMARRLLGDLARAATGILPPEEALQLCPHRPEDDCECRKPQAGMLLRIMAHYGVGPESTLFVGNSDVDRQAAARAGVAFLPADQLFGAAAIPQQ